MNLFENLQLMHDVEDKSYAILEMSKLVPHKANKNNCGDLDVFVYFSPCLDSHGPRVKFFGGTKETNSTRNSPSLTFGINGAEKVLIQSWMTKKNCPNAYNEKIINNVKQFVNKTLPILLLVWFEKLDESDALDYFQGKYTFDELLFYITDTTEEVKNELLKAKDLNDLHDRCKRFCMYSF